MITIIKMGAAFGIFCFVCNYNQRIDIQKLTKHNITLSNTIERLKYDISKKDKIIEKLIKEHGWMGMDTKGKSSSGFTKWLKEKWIYIVLGLLICYIFLS